MSRMVIDLPSDTELRCEQGLVSLWDDRMDKEEAPAPAPYGLRRWLIQLGGASRVQLTVAQRETFCATTTICQCSAGHDVPAF